MYCCTLNKSARSMTGHRSSKTKCQELTVRNRAIVLSLNWLFWFAQWWKTRFELNRVIFLRKETHSILVNTPVKHCTLVETNIITFIYLKINFMNSFRLSSAIKCIRHPDRCIVLKIKRKSSFLMSQKDTLSIYSLCKLP